MVAASDRYGLSKALNAYEVVYTGLNKQYNKEYSSLEEHCNSANVYKGHWTRKSAELNAGNKLSEQEKQSLRDEIRKTIKSMDHATEKTRGLLESFTKGANFLDTRPVPEFCVQPDKQKLDLWRDDLQGKLRTISILFEDIQRRSHLAKLEGERVYQLIKPESASVFSSMWYALGRSSNVIDPTTISSSESESSSAEESLSDGEGTEMYEHRVEPSLLKSGRSLSDYRGGPDSQDVLGSADEIDESTVDLRGRQVSSRGKGCLPSLDLIGQEHSSRGGAFSVEQNRQEPPLQFSEEADDIRDYRVGTVEESSTATIDVFVEKKSPNLRRKSVEEALGDFSLSDPKEEKLDVDGSERFPQERPVSAAIPIVSKNRKRKQQRQKLG